METFNWAAAFLATFGSISLAVVLILPYWVSRGWARVLMFTVLGLLALTALGTIFWGAGHL